VRGLKSPKIRFKNNFRKRIFEDDKRIKIMRDCPSPNI